jgi:hypothetical protein
MKIKGIKKIHFHPFDYKLKFTKDKRFIKRDYGETNLTDKWIKIGDVNDEKIIKHFILHEALHVLLEEVIENTAKIKDLEDREEAIVRMVSPRLQQFIESNPDLIKCYLPEDDNE